MLVFVFRLALVKCYPGNHHHQLFFPSSFFCPCFSLSPLYFPLSSNSSKRSFRSQRSVGPFPMTRRLNAPLVFMMSTQIKITRMFSWTSFHHRQQERLLLVFSLLHAAHSHSFMDARTKIFHSHSFPFIKNLAHSFKHPHIILIHQVIIIVSTLSGRTTAT